MFRFEYPVFEHKNILKKAMLDELRDYPVSVSRLLLSGYGDGILSGCRITWEKDVLCVLEGILLYRGSLYRMEETCSLPCSAADRLTFVKVRFMALGCERDKAGGYGEISLSEQAPENGELELGRFRLQEGARLRCEYENFEDYKTEFDTVNRIHVPFSCADGAGLWGQTMTDYARELLDTGTENVFDICFAMQVLAQNGHMANALVRQFLSRNHEENAADGPNSVLYLGLLHILKDRQRGIRQGKKEGSARQMLLL